MSLISALASNHVSQTSSFLATDSYIGRINNVFLPENGSSVIVNCPILTSVDSVAWFMYDTDTTAVNVFTGINYAINTIGKYYCQATEQRGVYRSNTFTAYRVGMYTIYA